MPISHDSENIKLAKRILAGLDEDFDTMFDLAMRLKNERAFGYVRRILDRIRRSADKTGQPKNPLKLAQQLALVTFDIHSN
jgi:hypothetical protein